MKKILRKIVKIFMGEYLNGKEHVPTVIKKE